MAILINTKVHKALYDSNAITDEYPYTRPLFSDGWNSFIHFALGYATTAYNPLILPVFLGYKYVNHKPYDNTITDVEEYGLGMFAGCLIGEKYGSAGQPSNYMKLKIMGIIK